MEFVNVQLKHHNHMLLLAFADSAVASPAGYCGL